MRVSIGLPFYNSELTLIDALRSVFAQTFQDWELILVDDGSDDASLEIALRVDAPRVKVVEGKCNMGLSYRLNQVSQLAQGEYIARMDADDMMHPERLEQQVRYLDAHPTVDLVSTGMVIIDSVNRPTAVKMHKSLETRSSYRDILERGVIHHPTVLGRAEWFRRNLYDPSYVRAEDRELWCRTYPHSVFARLPAPLYFYRESGVNSLEKYLISYQTERKIFRMYGPSRIGWRWTAVLILKSYLKSCIHYCLGIIRTRKYLYRLKYALNSLNGEEQAMVNSTIMGILTTPIPGLPAIHPLTE